MSRVLIVSDDAKFIAASVQVLHSHTVRSWPLSIFDLTAAREFGADVILLDTLGNGGALVVRQRLLRDRILASIPLIAITENPAEAELLAAQGMISKSLSASALERMVGELALPSSLM